MKCFVLQPPGFRKLSHSSEMRNDALMHRDGIDRIKTTAIVSFSVAHENGQCQ